ncbi:peptidylprolyl isomerase [Permianibacter aggregans]|uniref:peptidylprolyl isomerase n=1 Tax=Permianibacter aggregans TaxID=1510150 RepID=A0A4R6UGF1_9GAMM|nr:peptidylprolyl isomerase [Permianibacter aggregans]QGX39808.1 peptidyl-prolyl cis-trans isomerase [Permianibacter aggregans]TDQ45900.1 parvulin-like peptidyl-prolyl cis-trans isomerase protein [Permianibacter aggregans]
MSFTLRASLLCAMACMVACSDSKIETNLLPDDDVVVAKVNGEAISAYDWQQAIVTNLGEQNAFLLDDDARLKVLQSLAAAKAMAQKERDALTPTERLELEKQIEAYREQLLVKRYLKAHTDITPVTSEMVEAYYQKYPERFGATRTVEYQLIRLRSGADGEKRNTLVSALQKAATPAEWSALTSNARKANSPFEYIQQKSVPNLLQAPLSSIVANTAKGSISEVYWVEGLPLRVRVIDEQWSAAKPLADVSAEIRKTLAPSQVKKAVKQATDDILKESKIEYLVETP